jgi:O-antigen ligase
VLMAVHSWIARSNLLIVRKIIPLIGWAIFAYLLPTSWFIPLGHSFVSGVLEMYVTPGLYASDIGIAAVFLGVLCQHRRKRQLNGIFHGIFWPLIAIPMLALFYSPFAHVPGLAWYSAVRWLIPIGVFLCLFYLDLPMNHIVAILSISLALQAIAGIAQAIFQQPLGFPGEMTLSLQNPDAAAIRFSGDAWLRSYGLTFHPNVLGGYLMSVVILILPLLDRRPFRVLWLVFAGGLFLTFSRSAWLGAAFGLVFLFWWYLRQYDLRPKQWVQGLVVALVGAVLLLILFLPQIASRLNPVATLSEFTSLSGRGEMIDIALKSIRDDPLTGLGAGNFPVAMLGYLTLDAPHFVHNVFLLLGAEVGIPGGMIWLWLWIFPMVILKPQLNQKNPWPVVLALAWFAWGLVSLWDSYPWALETGRLFTVTLLALYARINQPAGNDECI